MQSIKQSEMGTSIRSFFIAQKPINKFGLDMYYSIFFCIQMERRLCLGHILKCFTAMFCNSLKINAEAIYVHSEFFTTVVITHPQRRTCERTCSVCLTVPAIKTYAHIFHTDTIAVVH